MSCKLRGTLALSALDLLGIPTHDFAFYLSPDTVLDAGDALVGVLASDRVAKSFAKGKPPKGKFKLPKGVDVSGQRFLVVVDANNEVPETDEGNNTDAGGALPTLP
jgi:hypothetical protein